MLNKASALKKTLLDFEPDFGFTLFAIVSPARAFKLCWHLDEKLNLCLHRQEDLQLTSKRAKQSLYFPLFEHVPADPEEESYLDYQFIGNKTSNGYLIPEQKVVDYYFRIEGELLEKEIESVEDTLSSLPGVQHVFKVDANTLKSKQNLIL